LRCAVTNVGENSWNFIAAAYWAAAGAGKEDMVIEYLDIGYEYVCTCQEDMQALIKSWGGDQDGGRSAYMLSTCSESGQVKGNDVDKARKERLKAKIEANMRALKLKAYNRIKEAKQAEMEAMMASKGEDGKKELERQLMEAFAKFKAEATRLEDKSNVSESEAKALETLEQEYLAMKAVKDEIVMADVRAEINAAKEKDGIEGLQALADATSLDIGALSKKLKEFPDELDVQLELNSIETKMALI